MTLRIGFIQANNDIDVQWFKPLAFGYLKAYLLTHLKSPFEMDLLASSAGLEKYDVAAISSTSQNYSKAVEIARKVKRLNKEIIVILGGHHITYLPETLAEEFDMGITGEGEKTFLDVAGHLVDSGNKPKPEILKKIKGLVFRENGDLIGTGRRELLDIDMLPHPYREPDGDQYLFTSRGCPYQCTFCSSSAFWQKTRFFSAEYVLEEIEQILRQFPAMKQIPIWDDLFIANKPRFMKIMSMIEDRRINEKVSFSFSVRANLVDDDMCRALKRLNIAGVAFGAESGSERILKLMRKGTTVEQNQRAIDLLNKYHIPVMCSFIVGWPTETEEEVNQTFEFILRNHAEGKLPASNAVNILMPIPGTELWENAVAQGLIDTNGIDWNRFAVFASYKDSNLRNFSEWADVRRKNESIYLAEKTLPQERLYELMAKFYESLDGSMGRKATPGKKTPSIQRRIEGHLILVEKNFDLLKEAALLCENPAMTRNLQSGVENLLQICVGVIKTLFVLLEELEKAAQALPELNPTCRTVVSTIQKMDQVFRSFDSCADLQMLMEKVRGELVPFLYVWPEELEECKTQIHECFSGTLVVNSNV